VAVYSSHYASRQPLGKGQVRPTEKWHNPLFPQNPQGGLQCVYNGNMVFQIMTLDISATVRDRDMVSMDDQ